MNGFIKVHTKFGEVIINISTIQRVYRDPYQCYSSCIVLDDGRKLDVIEAVHQIEEQIKEASK